MIAETRKRESIPIISQISGADSSYKALKKELRSGYEQLKQLIVQDSFGLLFSFFTKYNTANTNIDSFSTRLTDSFAAIFTMVLMEDAIGIIRRVISGVWAVGAALMGLFHFSLQIMGLVLQASLTTALNLSYMLINNLLIENIMLGIIPNTVSFIFTLPALLISKSARQKTLVDIKKLGTNLLSTIKIILYLPLLMVGYKYAGLTTETPDDSTGVAYMNKIYFKQHSEAWNWLGLKAYVVEGLKESVRHVYHDWRSLSVNLLYLVLCPLFCIGILLRSITVFTRALIRLASQPIISIITPVQLRIFGEAHSPKTARSCLSSLINNPNSASKDPENPENQEKQGKTQTCLGA